MMRAIGMGPSLARLGHTVTIIAEDDPDNRDLINACEGIEAVYVQRGSLVGDMTRKSDIVASGAYDVAHSCGLDVRTALTKRGRRATFWIVDHVEKTSSLPGMRWHKKQVWRCLENWSLRAADATVAASRYLEMTIRARMFARNCVKPLLWLPYAVAATASQQIAASRSSHPKFDPRTIMYAGGLYAGYGVHTLLDAVARLPRDTPEWKLLILGSGPERDRLLAARDAAGLQDRVEFGGYLPMPEYLAALARADVLVSPMHDTEADWARCPSKLYFYVAARTPIVTAPIGENCEVLGQHGFYYTPGDAADMATALRNAIAASGAENKPVVDPSLHTWDSRASRYTRWLESALRSHA